MTAPDYQPAARAANLGAQRASAQTSPPASATNRLLVRADEPGRLKCSLALALLGSPAARTVVVGGRRQALATGRARSLVRPAIRWPAYLAPPSPSPPPKLGSSEHKPKRAGARLIKAASQSLPSSPLRPLICHSKLSTAAALPKPPLPPPPPPPVRLVGRQQFVR